MVHALLLGDSIGLTLGEGLETESTNWGVSINDQADIGCDLDPTSTVNIMGQVSAGAQGCAHWQSDWAGMVAAANPDVVAILLGRWEVSDRLIGGHWVTVGDPAWDSKLTALLDQAVSVVSAQGAKVVLLTLPYVQQNSEQPDGSPWPINLPSRTDAFNALLRQVAAAHPGVASVVDLNHVLDPDGHYTDVVDGVAVRAADQEHISLAGGELARPLVLPAFERLGLAHALARP